MIYLLSAFVVISRGEMFFSTVNVSNLAKEEDEDDDIVVVVSSFIAIANIYENCVRNKILQKSSNQLSQEIFMSIFYFFLIFKIKSPIIIKQ